MVHPDIFTWLHKNPTTLQTMYFMLSIPERLGQARSMNCAADDVMSASRRPAKVLQILTASFLTHGVLAPLLLFQNSC